MANPPPDNEEFCGWPSAFVPCDDCSTAESPQALADPATAASALTQH